MGNIRWVDALRVQKGEVIAFVGAGGKTTTMLALARELEAMHWRVLVTTTTKMWMHQLEHFHTLPANTPSEQINAALDEHRVVSLYGAIDGEKAFGIEPDALEIIYRTMQPDALLIEADGARGLPLKFPREHEPVIPSFATLVVPIASMQVLGQPLDEDHVMNAAGMAKHFDAAVGNPVTFRLLRRLLLDRDIILKNMPPRARAAAIISQVTPKQMNDVIKITNPLSMGKLYQEVVMGDERQGVISQVRRVVTPLVLAAGLSTRMGQSKVLLKWRSDKTILEWILITLEEAGIVPAVVVTGNRGEEVAQIARDNFYAHAVHNADYATGEMLSSLKVGLRAMPENTEAALIVLGDQPSIRREVVEQVLQKYAETLAPIVAPSYQMKRGHPILIDRSLWAEILALPDDGAPRDVINAHANEIAYVNVDDDSILRDVDTPEAYLEERRRAGLDE